MMERYSKKLIQNEPFALIVSLIVIAIPAYGQLFDDSWTFTVGGQTVQANDDGSFHIPNIAAPDQFGLGGPGTPPDFVSDDFVRVIGTSTANGVTRYAFSEPFQFSQGETFIIGEMTITDTPMPLPTKIVLTAVSDLIPTGDTTQLTVTGTLPDGSTTDLTLRSLWTVYRTSNPAVASVGENGLVTSVTPGVAFITAVNEGATSVKRLTVTADILNTTIQGFVQLEDGSALSGASVTTPFGDSTTTSGDGSFSFSVQVPSEGGARVTASAIVAGSLLAGSSGVLEVIPDGLTDAGIVVMTSSRLWGSVPQTGQLVIVDTATGATQEVATIPVNDEGEVGFFGNITEIEWSPDDSALYATTGGGNSLILTIDPATGDVLSSTPHPFGGLNGLAFDANGNLLATFVPSSQLQSSLVQVDLATGQLTTIGATGFNNIGGLAFDAAGTLFGITSSNQIPPALLSIDPSTGQGSVIATTNLEAEASSLEIDASGRLLTGASDGNFYEINPVTGAATLIGPMGVEKLSGLSIGPPSPVPPGPVD